VKPVAIDRYVLQQIPTEQRRLNLYFRTVHLPFYSEPKPLRRSQEGRWATSTGTIYTATSEQVAWAEYCRQISDDVNIADPTGGVGLTRNSFTILRAQELGTPVPARALYGIEVEFERIANLTTLDARSTLEAAGFDLPNFVSDDYGRCSDLAVIGEELEWEALIVPSAALRRNGDFCIPIFAANKVLTHNVTHLKRSTARPTIATAYLTHYKEGERPKWLGT